jgi:hypothetical protein
MKKEAVLSFFTLLVFLQGQSQAIQNAGFEKGDTSKWVFASAAYNKFAKDAGFTFTIVSEAKEGKFSARLFNTGQGIWCELKQRVYYKPTAHLEKVRLSAYVKTKDNHTGYVSLLIRPIRNGKLLPITEGIRIDSSPSWTKLYVDVVVPGGTDSLLLACSLEGDGTAWFDDLRLEKSAEPIRQAVSAKQYLDTALAIISRTALYKDSVDLKTLVADAGMLCADAKTTSDCYGAITYVLQGLGDHHSFFLTPEQAKQGNRSGDTTMAMPSGKLIDGNIG